MKKMEIGFDNTIIEEAIIKMEKDLIYMLEIDISNGVLVDKGVPVLINDKTVHYPKILERGVSDKYSINYDPFFLPKLVNWMFTRYAVIRQMEDSSLSIPTFCTNKLLIQPDYLYATCRTNHGDITSRPFVNEQIAWINLIYKMEYNDDKYELFRNIDQYVSIQNMLLEEKKRNEFEQHR